MKSFEKEKKNLFEYDAISMCADIEGSVSRVSRGKWLGFQVG